MDFTIKKFYTLIIVAVLTCAVLCGTFFINTSSNILPPSAEEEQDLEETKNDEEIIIPEVPPIIDKDPTDNNVYNYLTEVKKYSSGITAYNGAIRYLEECNSYKIQSYGSLNASMGVTLNATINFETIYKNETYYNLFSIYSNMFNSNIQAYHQPTAKITHRANNRTDLKEWWEWNEIDYKDSFNLFTRKIIVGKMTNDTATISGFRKTSSGYKFTLYVSKSEIMNDLSKLLKELAALDVKLTLKNAAVEVQLNKYGAPVTLKYSILGTACVSGITVDARASLVENYGEFNLNSVVEEATYGIEA